MNEPKQTRGASAPIDYSKLAGISRRKKKLFYFFLIRNNKIIILSTTIITSIEICILP